MLIVSCVEFIHGPLRLSGPWDHGILSLEAIDWDHGTWSLEAIRTLGHGPGDLGTLSLEAIGTMDSTSASCTL